VDWSIFLYFFIYFFIFYVKIKKEKRKKKKLYKRKKGKKEKKKLGQALLGRGLSGQGQGLSAVRGVSKYKLPTKVEIYCKVLRGPSHIFFKHHGNNVCQEIFLQIYR